LKAEPFKHRQDPEFFAGACMMATQAISEFYAQGSTTMLLPMLYRNAYNMVLYKKGAELYSAMETAMASEVQSLWRTLNDAAPAKGGAAFLQELLAKWNQHVEAVKMTRDMLMYMDWTFVPTNRKTPIRELGLRLWRDQLTSSDEIRERLIEAVKRRGREDELVAAVNKMLTELGPDVPGFFFQRV